MRWKWKLYAKSEVGAIVKSGEGEMSWRGEWAYKYEGSLREASTRIFDFKQSEQWWHWWEYGRRHWRRYGRNSTELEDGSWALKLGIWDIHYQEALWFIRFEVDISGIVEANMDFTLEDPKHLKERHHTLFLSCATSSMSVSANLSLLMSLMLLLFLLYRIATWNIVQRALWATQG